MNRQYSKSVWAPSIQRVELVALGAIRDWQVANCGLSPIFLFIDILLKLDIHICTRLYILHDINNRGSVVGGPVPDVAAIIVGNTRPQPRDRATVGQRGKPQSPVNTPACAPAHTHSCASARARDTAWTCPPSAPRRRCGRETNCSDHCGKKCFY